MQLIDDDKEVPVFRDGEEEKSISIITPGILDSLMI